MPLPCSVCAHMQRADIDRRLAFQVVNMAEIARQYGLGKDAVRTHRRKHLPQFLPAFQARADALTLPTLAAEAQRLYLVTLDALAAAEAGTLVSLDEDGIEHRKVSSTAVARLIREARSGLGLLANLAADAAPPDDRPEANAELDARIAAALDRAASRALTAAPSPPVLDVEVIDDLPVDEGIAADAERVAGGTQGPGPGRRPRPRAGSESPSILTTPPVDPGPEDSSSNEASDDVRTRLIAFAAKKNMRLNPSTTLEELHALGLDVSALPIEGTVAEGPVVPKVSRRSPRVATKRQPS